MQQHAGVFRTQASMDEGVNKRADLRERVAGHHASGQVQVFNTARIEALEVENLIEAARPPWCRPPPATNAVARTP